jgi:hypothetical protein
VSQPSEAVVPFHVTYSDRCREATSQLLTSAREAGRFVELAQVVRGIHTRLEWIPLDFGEPLRDHVALALREYIGVLSPLVVRYAVDEERRLVYVSRPFQLLSGSGLETAPDQP